MNALADIFVTAGAILTGMFLLWLTLWAGAFLVGLIWGGPRGSDPFEPSDCTECDGFGMCWNNADPTSGQWVACGCGDTRGQP